MNKYMIALIESQNAQPITQKDLISIKNAMDGIFKARKMELVWTRHFIDRVNDPRNGKQITVGELITLFNAEYRQHGPKLALMPHESEAVLKDANSGINIMAAFMYNPRTKLLELRNKSIMRKRNFVPNNKSDPVFSV